MGDRPEGVERETVWDRLRRRKVVQWGITYAAGAWGLQQGIAYVSSLLGWPAQLQKLSGLGLLLGLPFALTLAWYHGDRGEQRVTRMELAVLALLFLAGGGLFWRYQQRIDSPAMAVAQPTGAPATAGAAIPADRSIAVLPFVNMSSDKEQEYFSDGISEELLNLLAQVPQLRVIARTSSFSFKGREADVATIARTLNVANVLEGSVRKSGDTLRITAQLIRASDSSHLWSQTYDRRITDVFEVQDEIAAAVVEQLKIKLLGAAPTARVTDPDAYALFLQARALEYEYTPAALTKSTELYKQSVAIDPTYAPGWVGLGFSYLDQMAAGIAAVDQLTPLVREAGARAIALDPGYAEVYGLLGELSVYADRDLGAAAKHVEQALALDPANAEAWYLATTVARRLGRMEQAVALGEHGIRIDPLNVYGHQALGSAYRYSGRLDDALREYRAILGLSPEAVQTHAMIGEILLQQGAADAALAEMQLETDRGYRLAGLAVAYQALGKSAESRAALADLEKQYSGAGAVNIAVAFAYCGDADRAFTWLEKAVQKGDNDLGAVGVYPLLANLHSDPRWVPFLRRLGQSPEQLAAIRFDVKAPSSPAA